MTDPKKLTIDSALEVLGGEDTTQLTVRGHNTQNAPLQTWEDQSAAVVAQIDEQGVFTPQAIAFDDPAAVGNLLTLSSGVISVTQGFHLVAAESGTADDLVTINLGLAGIDNMLLILEADAGDTITVKHDTGNIALQAGSDFTLSGHKRLVLIYRSSVWADVGAGASGGGATALDDLTDVNEAAPQDNDVLKYDSGAGEWRGEQQVAADVVFTPAGNLAATHVQAALQELDSEKAAAAHQHALDDLSDVDAASPNDGDVLAYDDASGDWVAQAPPLPTGALLLWPTDTPPSGFLLCYGQAVSRTTYADLFAVLGTTFGVGDGSTTFNLPDLRGRLPVGQDDMGGTAAGRVSGAQSLGSSGGAQDHVLTTAQLPVHSHSTAEGNSLSGSYHYGGLAQYVFYAYAATTTAGSGQAHNNMPPYLTLNYIIKT